MLIRSCGHVDLLRHDLPVGIRIDSFFFGRNGAATFTHSVYFRFRVTIGPHCEFSYGGDTACTEKPVGHRSHLSDLHDTASLLGAAAQRHQQGGSEASLLSCLLDEVFSSLSAEHVHVWEVVASTEPRLLWKRGQTEGVPAHAKQAAFGLVKRISAPLDPSGRHTVSNFVTSCEVGEGYQIVLDLAVPDDYFDQQKVLELVEVLADLHRRSLVTALLQNSRRAQELHQILRLLHSNLDPIGVATSLASDTAEFLNYHRISVARKRSRTSWELVAATGVSQPDPRSDASRRLCGIIEEACHSSDSPTIGSGEAGIRSQLSTPGAESDSQGYCVRPMTVSGRWDDAEWAAVFEWPADATVAVSKQVFFSEICSHAALAFQNCKDHSNAGIMSVFRRLPQTIRSRRMLVAGSVTAAVIAGMVFLEMDLQIEVMGKLVPSQRVFVFAPEDGVITDVFVEDGSSVALDGRLCALRNEDLEIQLESIDGEVASTQARLAALESLRGDRSLTQSGMLSVEQAELKERLISLEAQAVILNSRISRLRMHAAIPGQVYGDRLQELLKGRPVQRGQYLFELANPDGGWQLDMRIPEVDVRHVINGQAESKSPLTISFAVETDPEKEMTTSLTRLAASTDIDDFGRLSVLATAIPGKADIPSPRPGAGVVGHIHCGRRSAGYVMFRRIIESFQRRWWK